MANLKLTEKIYKLLDETAGTTWSNPKIATALGLDPSSRQVRKATQYLAEQAKIAICKRKGSYNIYKKLEKVLSSEQIAYHAGFEAGIRASNIDAFNEGKKTAVRAIAKKLNINLS